MPKISLVIPTYTLNQDLEELTYDCIDSMRDQVDEVVISEDGGGPIYYYLADGRVDIYIYHAKNIGFTGNVNRGWKAATGDFVIIANSDTKLLQGDLKDLCIPGKITSPIIVNQGIEGLAGCFFCVPKEIAKERGMLNETMKTYYSDQDYADRTSDIFQKVPTVQVWHEQMQTVKEAGVEGKMDEDRDIYNKLQQ